MKPGDRVEYHLLPYRWIPATVIRIGPKRITIVDDKFQMRRYVAPSSLRSPMSDHPTVFIGGRKYIESLIKYFHDELDRIAGFLPLPPCVIVTFDSQIGYGATPAAAFHDLIERHFNGEA